MLVINDITKATTILAIMEIIKNTWTTYLEDSWNYVDCHVEVGDDGVETNNNQFPRKILAL